MTEPTGVLLACTRTAKHVANVVRHGHRRSLKHHVTHLAHIAGRPSYRSVLACVAIGGNLLVADVETPTLTKAPVPASPAIVVADLTASSKEPASSDAWRMPDSDAAGAILLPPVGWPEWLGAVAERNVPALSASASETLLPSSAIPISIELTPSPDWLHEPNSWKVPTIASFALLSLTRIPLTREGRQTVAEPGCTAVLLTSGVALLWAIRRRPQRDAFTHLRFRQVRRGIDDPGTGRRIAKASVTAMGPAS